MADNLGKIIARQAKVSGKTPIAEDGADGRLEMRLGKADALMRLDASMRLRTRIHRGARRVSCPVCAAERPIFALAEVSAVPARLRGAARFACDGCTTRWIRDGDITESILRDRS